MVKILTSLGMVIGYLMTVLGFWRSDEGMKHCFLWSLCMLAGVILLFLSVLLFCVPEFFSG